MCEVARIDEMPHLSLGSGMVAYNNPWEKIEGVLLNSALLETFGFTFQEQKDSWHREPMHVIEINGECFFMQANTAMSKKPMRYLHELQNLFYVITGFELINSEFCQNGLNDYRIGNWVNWGKEEQSITVISADEADSKLRDENSLVRSTQFTNIQLSPSWLSRLGFNIDNITCLHPRFPSYLFLKQHDGYTLQSSLHTTVSRQPLKYVHQLQNLFFALTGEELSIK